MDENTEYTNSEFAKDLAHDLVVASAVTVIGTVAGVALVLGTGFAYSKYVQIRDSRAAKKAAKNN